MGKESHSRVESETEEQRCLPKTFLVDPSFCHQLGAGLKRLTTEGVVVRHALLSAALAEFQSRNSKVKRCGKLTSCQGQERSLDAHQELCTPLAQDESNNEHDDEANSKYEVGIHHETEKCPASNVLQDLEPRAAFTVDDGSRSSAKEDTLLSNDLTKLEIQGYTSVLMEIDETVVRHEDKKSGLTLFEEQEEDILNPKDQSDGDKFKNIWEDAQLVFACINDPRKDKEGSELHKEEVDKCDHKFDFVNRLGSVCRFCQLISGHVFESDSYVKPLKRRKRQDAEEAEVLLSSSLAVAEEGSETTRLLLAAAKEESEATPLLIHPDYSHRMYAHQKEGFDFLRRNLARRVPGGCILAHAPGTGKTFLVISFLHSFLSSFPETKPLVVAPNSMLNVWEGEFRKWRRISDMMVLNLNKTSSNKTATDHHSKYNHELSTLNQWKSSQRSILLVGYVKFWMMVMRNSSSSSSSSLEAMFLSETLLTVPGLLVMDEGHNVRTKDTRLHQALSQVGTRRRILLSGTLFQNSFTELYNMYRLVRPDFTEVCNKDSFANLGNDILSKDRDVSSQAIQRIRLLSKPLVHYYKGQLLERLPGLVDLILIMNLTIDQQRILNSLNQSFRQRKKRNGRESAMAEAAQLTKLCIHPWCMKGKKAMEEEDPNPRDSAKTMFVMDLLQLSEAVGEKVLVFSELLSPFDLLERILGRRLGWTRGKEILRIEGQTSLEDRGSLIDRVNNDSEVKILLASIMTCGEGVSLVGTSRVVFLDLHWNPARLRQAVSRAFRMGQKRKVFVYRLVAVPEEEKCNRVCEKEWVAKQVFEDVDIQTPYSQFQREVHPRDVDDPFFQSPLLLQNVCKSFILDS